jgi:hypothetical protein
VSPSPLANTGALLNGAAAALVGGDASNKPSGRESPAALLFGAGGDSGSKTPTPAAANDHLGDTQRAAPTRDDATGTGRQHEALGESTEPSGWEGDAAIGGGVAASGADSIAALLDVKRGMDSRHEDPSEEDPAGAAALALGSGLSAGCEWWLNPIVRLETEATFESPYVGLLARFTTPWANY